MTGATLQRQPWESASPCASLWGRPHPATSGNWIIRPVDAVFLGVSAENPVTASGQHLSYQLAPRPRSAARAACSLAVAFGLVYLLLARVLSWLALLARSEAAKDAAILVLESLLPVE